MAPGKGGNLGPLGGLGFAVSKLFNPLNGFRLGVRSF